MAALHVVPWSRPFEDPLHQPLSFPIRRERRELHSRPLGRDGELLGRVEAARPPVPERGLCTAAPASKCATSRGQRRVGAS